MDGITRTHSGVGFFFVFCFLFGCGRFGCAPENIIPVVVDWLADGGGGS